MMIYVIMIYMWWYIWSDISQKNWTLFYFIPHMIIYTIIYDITYFNNFTYFTHTLHIHYYTLLYYTYDINYIISIDLRRVMFFMHNSDWNSCINRDNKVMIFRKERKYPYERKARDLKNTTNFTARKMQTRGFKCAVYYIRVALLQSYNLYL